MKKEEIVDSVMLFWDDPRINKETIDELRKLPMCTIFSYDTSNIYICNFHNSITREIRDYLKVKKSIGQPITFNDAMIKLMVKKINHENMHRILSKTIDKKTAVYYDRLMNGFSTKFNSMAPIPWDDEEILY